MAFTHDNTDGYTDAELAAQIRANPGQEWLMAVMMRDENGTCKINPVGWDTGLMDAAGAYDLSRRSENRNHTVIWTGDVTGDRFAFKNGRILWQTKGGDKQ